MNSTVERLLTRFNSPFNPDFWSEIECPALAEILKNLDDSDWQDLVGCLNKLSDVGKIHLADAVCEADHIMRDPILVELIRSPNPDVGAHVAVLMIDNDYTWDPKVSILADVKRHRDQNEGYKRKILDRLILRLPR